MDFKLSHCLRELNLHGVQLAPEEFCDALWLTALGFVEGQSRIIPAIPQRQDAPQPSSNPPAAHTDQTSAPLQLPPSQSVHALGGSSERTMRGSLLSLPAAPAIANGIEFDRAFKPLRQRRVIARTVELDEEATVNAIAETGIWQIIMRPARGRWLDIVVVVEQSPTMRIWQETAREFRQLLWRTCSPRSLRTFHIEWLSKRLSVHTSGGRQVSNQSPAQGQGRRLILVLSDAMSFGWLTADIPELLAQWATSQTTTLVQMLPEAMWRRTALRQVLPAPGKELSPSADASPDQWAQVALTTLEPESLRRYARGLVGVTKESVASFRGSRSQFQVISPQTVEEKKPFDPQALSPDEIEKIFRRFEVFSSPGAKRLARHLASAPLVLPVMRLVQRVLVPDSAPSQLAEVFLSGIMFRQQTEPGTPPQSNQLVYEFLPGIRERLIDLGGLDCLFATAELISEYVEKRLGKGGAFTALLEDPNAAAKEWSIAPSSAAKDEPFAHVARVLLAHMGSTGSSSTASNESWSNPSPIKSRDQSDSPTGLGPVRSPREEDSSIPTSRLPFGERKERGISSVFISAVFREFGSLRDILSRSLSQAGIQMVRRDDFLDSDVNTLEAIDAYIQNCDAVVHFIGKTTGATPHEHAVATLTAKYPDLGARLPTIADHLNKPQHGLSYTQWEAYLTIYHRRPIFVYQLANTDTEPSFSLGPGQSAVGIPDEFELQEQHCRRLRGLGHYAVKLDGEAQLQRTLLADLARYHAKPTLADSSGPHTVPTGKPCNLPYTSIGTLFKGRDEFLAELRQHLTAEGPVVIKGKRTIHGMGGVGKTRAAIEYAWKHADDYRALLFISADTADALQGNLAALCGPLVLNLPEQSEKEQALQVEAALRWLKLNRDWLLIIDNVDTDEAAEEVRSLLGKLSTGHVLITSRIADWSGMVKSVELDILSESAAIAFLDERTEERRPKRDDDREQVAKVVRMLDCLVLALEQAGAHISSSAISYADYIRLAESHKAETLAWHEEEKMEYPRSLAITYETSIAQLSSGARDLFQILSWFAPDPIPRNLLDSRPTPAEERRHLGEIERLHLVRFVGDGKSFIIHRLTQEITRQRQVESSSTLRSALEWLYQAMPEDAGDVRTWPVVIPLVPHALMSATFGADRGIGQPCGSLFRSVGTLFHAQANFSMAESLLRRALTLHEARYGASHSEVSCDLNHLAELLISTNRLAEAEPLLRRALVIDGAESGNSHPDVSRDLNNLAQLLVSTNRLAEAEPLLRQSLAIDEATYPASHPAIVSRLNNLASLLQSTNRLSEAEPLIRRALSIAERTLGENHPDVANVLNNYAQMLRATNRLDEAEPLIRRALAIDETVLGDEHPKVARDLNDLAQVLHAANRLAEAEPLMRRALAIDKAALGEDHPDVAIRLNNLASLLKDTKRADEAKPLLHQALDNLKLFRRQTGYDHSQLMVVTTNFDSLIEKALDGVVSTTVFITYLQTNDSDRRRVREFGERLRSNGIDVVLDQFFLEEHPGGPSEGWPKWTSVQALQTSHVIVIGSQGWFDCFEAKRSSQLGLGAATEAATVRRRLSMSGGISDGIRVVLLDDSDAQHVPSLLARYGHFHAERDFHQIVLWLTATAKAVTHKSDTLSHLGGDGLESEPSRPSEISINTDTGRRAMAYLTTQDSDLPFALKIGRLQLSDQKEADDYNHLQQLMSDYVDNPGQRRPLCVGVFGEPGAGKSFGVKELASEMSRNKNCKLSVLEFNLAQFREFADLQTVLHKVRDNSLLGSTPVVFFDEFDASFDGREFAWLKHFLEPMQHGSFFDEGASLPIGRAIFIFAAGAHHSFKEFMSHMRQPNFTSAKGPDFISRLRAVLTVNGVNSTDHKDHDSVLLRRAILIRDFVERRVGTSVQILMDAGLARAFLGISEYRHGIRSLESIVEMSRITLNHTFTADNLPSEAQLGMHVDAQEFMSLCGRK